MYMTVYVSLLFNKTTTGKHKLLYLPPSHLSDSLFQCPLLLFHSQGVAVSVVQLQCCGITGYNDYNVDIWNTNPGIWRGRNPNVLAPLTCCVQNDDSNVYPPTINDLSPSCLYNGTVPSDYYQPVGHHLVLA